MKQTLKSGTWAVILTLCALGLAYGAVNSALGQRKCIIGKISMPPKKQRGSACWFSALCFWVPCWGRSLTSALISAVKSRLYAVQGENPAFSRLRFWPRPSSAVKCDIGARIQNACKGCLKKRFSLFAFEIKKLFVPFSFRLGYHKKTVFLIPLKKILNTPFGIRFKTRAGYIPPFFEFFLKLSVFGRVKPCKRHKNKVG